VAVSLTAMPTASAAVTRSGGRPVRGLDISAYQHAGGPINWQVLARHGIRFVAIKVSEGTYYTNPYYSTDASAAARAGLAVLPYVFANPPRAGGAITARFAARAAGYRRGHAALPLVVDLENDPFGRNDCYGFGSRRMVAWIAGFTARARALTGTWPVIYTTAAWWQECTGSTSRFTRDPLWLAAFGTSRPYVPFPWRQWAFWQYDNDGTLPGIGRTDLDYYQPVDGLSSLHPAAKPKPKPKPKKSKRQPKPKKSKRQPKKPKPKPTKPKPKPKKPKRQPKKPRPKHRPKPKPKKHKRRLTAKRKGKPNRKKKPTTKPRRKAARERKPKARSSGRRPRTASSQPYQHWLRPAPGAPVTVNFRLRALPCYLTANGAATACLAPRGCRRPTTAVRSSSRARRAGRTCGSRRAPSSG